VSECWVMHCCCYAECLNSKCCCIYCYDECQNAVCCFIIFMLSVQSWVSHFFIVILRVIMLNGISSVSWHLSDTSRVVVYICREFWRGKNHCTIDLLFDWFGISCMTTDIFCFYLQNGLIQTSQTGGQWYSDTSPFSIPWYLQPETGQHQVQI
jgi:hypothetical protein